MPGGKRPLSLFGPFPFALALRPLLAFDATVGTVAPADFAALATARPVLAACGAVPFSFGAAKAT